MICGSEGISKNNLLKPKKAEKSCRDLQLLEKGNKLCQREKKLIKIEINDTSLKLEVVEVSC